MRITAVYKQWFMQIEFLLSVVMVALIYALRARATIVDVVVRTLESGGVSVYGGITNLAGTLLGFVIASLSIMIAIGRDDALVVIRGSGQLATLMRVFTSAITWLGVLTIWALSGMLGSERLRPSGVMVYGTIWLLVLSALRLYRCAWVLRNIVALLVTAYSAKG